MQIATAIEKEALKLVSRHQRYISELHRNAQRYAKETGFFAQPTILRPLYWNSDVGFNPYKVRGRADHDGDLIQRALNRRRYRPHPACEYEVPKLGGGFRPTSVFQVADNALSRLVFDSLMAKNSARLSARCYAFRTDVGRHDAIFHAHQQLRTHLRVYVAEFDFKAFFDNLHHAHLLKLLGSKQFIITSRERDIIEAFLGTPSLPVPAYSRTTDSRRTQGIPQGTSISLFLANIAAFPLDQQLERLGVGFARYADDTLIWSSRYDELCRAVDAIAEASELMGAPVNLKKSPGISLLQRQGEKAEISAKSSVEYLGVALSRDHMSFKRTVVQRMKQKISYLIYRTLIQPLRNGHFLLDRVAPPVDRSYVTVLFQIRRYLYGGLSESKLRRYAAGIVPSIRFFGALASSPLVDDEVQLTALDGWLLHTIWCALRLRSRLILQLNPHFALPRPHNLDRTKLIGFKARTSAHFELDLRLPSFLRMSRLLRRASQTFGPGEVAAPGVGFYDADGFYGS